MSDDAFTFENYGKTWRWECPDHGRVEMFMTNPPICAACKTRCVKVAIVGSALDNDEDAR